MSKRNDEGHKETDELIEEIEKKIAKEYKQAAEEVQEKLDDYLRRFEIKDEKWQIMVANGTKSKAEYQQWRTGQMMIGKRWEDLRNQLAEDYHNANVIARKIVDAYLPSVYALNQNYAAYEIEHGLKADTSFTLVDTATVERMIRDDPDLLPPPGKRMEAKLAAGKDIKWQEGQIQSVMLQGILQGESIPNISKRIATTLGESNHASTVRYARTAATAAENAGRMESYQRAQSMGITMRKMWLATLDNRTRHEHRQLDGQTVAVDDPFKVDGEEIMYPGDPSAPGYLIWNCRCTQIAQLDGFERDPRDLNIRMDDKLGGMTYEEWLEAKPEYQNILHQERLSEERREATIRELYGGTGGSRQARTKEVPAQE